MTKLLPEERIKDLRVERRLTGKELCELIGVPESTYNGYELGNCKKRYKSAVCTTK